MYFLYVGGNLANTDLLSIVYDLHERVLWSVWCFMQKLMRNSLRHIREEPKVHCTLSTIRGHLINSYSHRKQLSYQTRSQRHVYFTVLSLSLKTCIKK